MSIPAHSVSRRSGWLLVGIAVVATIIVWPLAAGFYSPTAIGFVHLPGVFLFAALAVGCAVCFFLCPRRPLAPKLISLALTAHALYWALDAGAYYWLHSVYHA
jgi:Kef-type K+ transport system membrane component KefB